MKWRTCVSGTLPRLARLGGFGGVFNFFATQVLENQDRHRRKMAKVAVVQTCPVSTGEKMSIIQRHHVSTLQQTLQGWQAAPLLEHRRKQARGRRESRPAPRALPG